MLGEIFWFSWYFFWCLWMKKYQDKPFDLNVPSDLFIRMLSLMDISAHQENVLMGIRGDLIERTSGKFTCRCHLYPNKLIQYKLKQYCPSSSRSSKHEGLSKILVSWLESFYHLFLKLWQRRRDNLLLTIQENSVEICTISSL